VKVITNRCPNGCIDGGFPYQVGEDEWELEQCQWCAEQKEKEMSTNDYVIKIFVKGNPGFFQYSVGTLDQAADHMGKIVSCGYRRVNDRGQLVQHMPCELERVVVSGPKLSTEYPDKFIRT